MQRYRLRQKIYAGELLMMVLVICLELELEQNQWLARAVLVQSYAVLGMLHLVC